MHSNVPNTLRSHQMKVTPQRLAIASIVFAKTQHISAKQVKEQLKENFPSLSLNTIYLTLQQFSKVGLLHEVITSKRTLFDSNTSQHDHAECESCGALIDIPSQQPQQASALADWKITHIHCIWRGLCPKCKPPHDI